MKIDLKAINESRVLRLREEYFQLEPYIMNQMERLPKNLTYHNVVHTSDVMDSSGRLALLEGIKPYDARYWLIKIGALLHDIGYKIQPSGKDHEAIGAEYAKRLLGTDSGLNTYDLLDITGMIRATKLPQDPRTFLEKIVCDADVDNFGRDDFFSRGELLREELRSFGINPSDKQWYEGSLKLLEGHKYHTDAAKHLRDGKKKENIAELKKRIASLK